VTSVRLSALGHGFVRRNDAALIQIEQRLIKGAHALLTIAHHGSFELVDLAFLNQI